MKKSNKRILSLLTAVCMLLGMIVVPGGVVTAEAATALGTQSIPEAKKYYVNNDYEDGTSAISFLPRADGNIAEIRTGDSYLYLEKNAAEDPQIVRTLTEDEVTPYLVVEVALASTKLSGAALKLTGTTETLSFVTVDAEGKIYALGTDTGKTLTADGTFVTVTVSVDAVANTYSLWVDDVQAVPNADITVDAFGSVTAMSIELNGENTEAANLMVDDVKIYRYEPVLYYNDFNTDDGGFTYATSFASVNAKQYSEHKLDTETGEGYIYLRSHSNNNAVAWWNNGEDAVTLPDQFVVSFDHASLSAGSEMWVSLVDQEGDSVSLLWQRDRYYLKHVYLNDAGSTAYSSGVTFPLSTDTMNWRNVTMAFDMTKKTYSLWFENYDGTGTVEYLNLKLADSSNKFGTVKYISFTSRGDDTADGSVPANACFDNFVVYSGNAVRTVTADEVAGTAIPGAAETYVDNSFDTKDAEGNVELSGLTLAANAETNKAVAPTINHYGYLERNDTTSSGDVQLYKNFGTSIDSDYFVISYDIASTNFGDARLIINDKPAARITTDQGYYRLMWNNSAVMNDSKRYNVKLNGEYNNIAIVFDCVAETYALWLNGTMIKNGSWTYGRMTLFKLHLMSTPSNVMIDNLKIYSYDPEAAAPTYTVTWKNYDGTVLETDENVKAGTVPTYDGATPTKETSIHNVYTFSGWDTTPAAVTGDVTYTAQYTEEKTPCVDADPKDHKCDICTEIMGTHADGDDDNHTCDYCGGAVDGETCVDGDTDHDCDECGATMGVHESNSAHSCVAGKCEYCGADMPATTSHSYTNGTCACGAVAAGAVNGTYYDTIQDAIDAADAGSTVTLMNDVSLNETVTISTGIILDLNGKTITSEAVDSVAVRVNGADIAVTITGNGTITSNGTAVHVKNGTVTIENGTYTSTYTAGAFKNAALYVGNEEDGNNGVAIINGGTFNGSTGHAYALRVCDGIITVNDGSFDGANNACCTGVMNIKGGSFTSNDVWSETEKDILYVENPSCNCGVGVINVTGGTFYGQNPAEASISSSATTSYVAEGYIAVEASGVYTVQEGKWMADVDGERYHDLQEAVDAAVESGATLVLTEDADTITVAENKTLVLNFNGKTVGEIVVNGTLYGIDETTKNYTAEPLKVKISGDGEVAPVHQVDTDGKDHTYAGYAAQVSEGYATFNYFEVKIASVTLRPSEAGIGYKLYLAGNANVKAMLNESNAFGVTVYPEGTEGKSASAGSASFAVGAQTKMVMIKNILSGDYSVQQNAENGKVKLCVSAYVNINGEKVEIAYTAGKSLVEVFNSINDNLGSYNDVQKAALKTLYNTYIKDNETVFTDAGWVFDKVKEITDPEQN